MTMMILDLDNFVLLDVVKDLCSVIGQACLVLHFFTVGGNEEEKGLCSQVL